MSRACTWALEVAALVKDTGEEAHRRDRITVCLNSVCRSPSSALCEMRSRHFIR